MSPIFIFAIDRSMIQNVDVTRQTFETIETIKYFLGVILDEWQQVFPKIINKFNKNRRTTTQYYLLSIMLLR